MPDEPSEPIFPVQNLATNAYEHMAAIGKALGNPTRLKIMNLLMQTERSVDELAEMIGHSAPNTSAHLKALQGAGLIARRRESRHVYYQLANHAAVRLWLALRDISLDESPALRESMATVPDHDRVIRTLDADALLTGVSDGSLTLLDLRPAEEYQAGHLPSSRSIPFDELESRLDELDPTTRIVAYCRGPFCYAAIESAKILRAHGYDTVRLYGGIGDWLAQGFSLEVDAPSSV